MAKRKKLKVFGGLVFCGRDGDQRGMGINQRRAVIAVPTKKLAAQMFHVSMYEFNQFFGETGNQTELNVALNQPGIVFVDNRDTDSAGFYNESPKHRRYVPMKWKFQNLGESALRNLLDAPLALELQAAKEMVETKGNGPQKHLLPYYMEYLEQVQTETDSRSPITS